MKKIIFVGIVSVFFSCYASLISAVEPTTIPLTIAPTAAQEMPVATASNEYVLPFPGMLPDHPLYNLKRVRDSILEFLIADPIRKVEFYVLQADKRLQMGIMLLSKDKQVLGESTISKGEKYLYKAVQSIRNSKNSGTPVPGYIVDGVEKSLGKHEEVLKTLVGKTTGAVQTGLQGSLELVQKLHSELLTLK